MLHKKTVTPETLELIEKLLAEEQLADFRLVGGTALSLQIGHRISIDIDLFINKPFDVESLTTYLSNNYQLQGLKILHNGIFCFINDIKVDIISHQYPWITPLVIVDGLRMASLEDIGAMKLHAIVLDGSRLKDFVDVFNLLEYLPLSRLTSAYERKYPETSKQIVNRALLFHDDIKPASIDYVGRRLELTEIISRLKEAIVNPDKVFPT